MGKKEEINKEYRNQTPEQLAVFFGAKWKDLLKNRPLV